MTAPGNTLHFINRIDDTNCGDRMACPLLYYYDYFKQYNIKRHDISYIDFDAISPNDVIIIGGGGLFNYAESINREINTLLDIGAPVIGWTPGLNTHNEFGGAFTSKLHFEKFSLLGIRDFGNKENIPFLPDITCKMKELKKHYDIRRRIGIAQHKDYPLTEYPYDRITNNESLEKIIQFIGESEIVISNSFHMIYWSLLLGKKTICANPFSSKFYTYKYPPEYCNSLENLETCIENAKNYDILDNCILENDFFFEKVKAIVEKTLIPDIPYWYQYNAETDRARLYQEYRSKKMRIGDLLVSQLFVDINNGFSEERKLIAINNVYGDEIHHVRYDLSAYPNIKALRFDPIESRNCEVEIVSASSSTGDVTLLAQAAIKNGTWDRFLSTDPQYIIFSPISDFLEINFRLNALDLYEAEQAVYRYVWEQERQLYKKAQQVERISEQRNEQDALLHQKTETINQLNDTLQCRQNQINQQEKEINKQTYLIDQQLEQIRLLKDTLQDCENQITKQNSRLIDQAEKIQSQTSCIDALYNSYSWKITAPLRFISHCFRILLKGKERK